MYSLHQERELHTNLLQVFLDDQCQACKRRTELLHRIANNTCSTWGISFQCHPYFYSLRRETLYVGIPRIGER